MAEIPSGPSRQPAYSLDKWQIGESTRETVLYLGGFVLFLASLPFVLFERVVDVDPWVGWLSFAGLVAAGLMVRAANKDKAR